MQSIVPIFSNFNGSIQPILYAISHPLPFVFYFVGGIFNSIRQVQDNAASAVFGFRAYIWSVSGQLQDTIVATLSQIPLLKPLIMAVMQK